MADINEDDYSVQEPSVQITKKKGSKASRSKSKSPTKEKKSGSPKKGARKLKKETSKQRPSSPQGMY